MVESKTSDRCALLGHTGHMVAVVRYWHLE